MQFEKLFIDGLVLVKPDILPDDRGFFLESYNKQKYDQGGISEVFVQDNISKSVFGTIRGLHYQVGKFAQGKLCSVLEGKVLDVAVDIRFGSSNFGRYYSTELSEENKFQLWIPPGFAHGFSVLSDYALFNYKCTNLYNKSSERSIKYNDSQLNIDWKISQPIVSQKDLLGKEFNEIEKDFIYSQEEK